MVAEKHLALAVVADKVPCVASIAVAVGGVRTPVDVRLPSVGDRPLLYLHPLLPLLSSAVVLFSFTGVRREIFLIKNFFFMHASPYSAFTFFRKEGNVKGGREIQG